MGARAQFPQFENLTAAEFARLLNLSKLSRDEKEIAAQKIIWKMDYIEIGENIGIDRRTVSRKMKDFILPELERMMHRERIEAGA